MSRQPTPNILVELEGAAVTRKVESIPILAVKVDGGTQMRAKLDGDIVTEYADTMRRGVEFPPVELVYDGSDYWVWDGFHRRRAHLEAFGSSEPIRAYVTPGTRRDAVLMAAGANADHGLRRTQADKARAVDALLGDDEWGQWSDREIARRCSVSHVFVGKRRKVLVKAEAIEPVAERKFVDKHGNESTMKAAKDVTGNVSSEHQPRGRCKICSRPLTDADSVAAGMGDVCAAHAAKAAGEVIEPSASSSGKIVPEEAPASYSVPQDQLQQGISQLPVGAELPADLKAAGWELRSMVGGGVWAVRSTGVCKDNEQGTAVENVVRSIRATDFVAVPNDDRGEVTVWLRAKLVDWLIDDLSCHPELYENIEKLIEALENAVALADPDPAATQPSPRRITDFPDWSEGWNDDDKLHYEDLGDFWMTDQIQRPRVALRLLDELPPDDDLRPALLRRYNELEKTS